MQALQTLIDKASGMCGGQNQLAKILGVSSGSLADMKAGRRTISPVTAILLADIAHEDTETAMRQAILASVEGTRHEYRLGEILGKAQAGGGGAVSPKYYGSRLNIENENDRALSYDCDFVTNQFTTVYIV